MRNRKPELKKEREQEIKKIIRERFKSEINLAFRHIEDYVRRRYFGGLFILFRAMLSTYTKHVKKMAFAQLSLVFDTIDRELDEELLKKILAKDITFVYLSKSHPNFPEVQKMTKESAIAVRTSFRILVNAGEKLRKWPVTYDDIARAAYPIAADARKVLEERVRIAEKVFEVLKKDARIVNVPIGRSLVLNIVREGIRYARYRISETLEVTYGKT